MDNARELEKGEGEKGEGGGIKKALRPGSASWHGSSALYLIVGADRHAEILIL